MSSILKDFNIGFLGLGLMGKPMCRNLLQSGASLVVYNRTTQVAEEMRQQYLTIASSPAELAPKVDFMVLMLSDTAAVESVLFGENGLSETIKPGSVVIDMGTTTVTATRKYANQLRELGVEYIDAPVSGGEIGAINGDLVIMTGGSQQAMLKVQPIFDVLGQSTVHIGDIGTGQITKAANQVIVGLNIGAVAEALTLAKRAGANISKVREALLGGFAASRILEVHGQRMIDESFKPGGKIVTQHKDLTQALELAEEFNQQLPATSLNRELYQGLIKDGKGELDHSALILALDRKVTS